MKMRTKYLITGATGEVGARVTRLLLELGERPRIQVRNGEKARALFGNGVDVFVGDLSVPETVRDAFHGADAVFLVNVGPEIPERDRRAAEVCRELSVGKIVKLSSLDVEQGLAIGAWHERGEEAIRETGVPFVNVRPTGFMSNLLAWSHAIKTEGVVRSSTGEGRRPFIHPEDIAAVSVKALMHDQYVGEALPITGPESLSFRDVTSVLAAAIEKPLRYEVISDGEARTRYDRVSGSKEETEAHVALWRAIREGRLAATTDCVNTVLGRSPIPLGDWIQENAHHFSTNGH
jgi:uncharacterized protein YbjT (DUF2867 family)